MGQGGRPNEEVGDEASCNARNGPGYAVIGETGTIDIAWSGLEPGTNYLGAVGHNDAEGVFGVTLVEVST